MLGWAAVCCAVLRCAALRCAVLCCAVLCCAVLCCAVPCFDFLWWLSYAGLGCCVLCCAELCCDLLDMLLLVFAVSSTSLATVLQPVHQSQLHELVLPAVISPGFSASGMSFHHYC